MPESILMEQLLEHSDLVKLAKVHIDFASSLGVSLAIRPRL